MAYNIDETISAGEIGHPAHHTALAVAVNDLDRRATAVEALPVVPVVHVDNISTVTPGTYPVDTLLIQRATI